MAIESNRHGIIPEYNPDEYLEKFIPLVLKECNEYTEFSIFELGKKLNLSEKDNLIFNDLTFRIRVHLIDNDLATLHGSRMVKLTEKGRDVKNGKEKIFGVVINNDFSNSTIGQLNQADFLNNKKTEIKQIIHPKTNEKQQNAIISFIEKFWWKILIPLAIGVLLILIEKGIIDIGI